MPANNKTVNLGLCNWLPSDKPKRADFVSDNSIIDETVGGHINDFDLHLSQADRALLAQNVVTGTLSGTGDASYTHTLPIEPKAVYVFLKNYPPCVFDPTNQYNLCCSGAAFAGGIGGTAGVTLNGNKLTLLQTIGTPQGLIFLNLNKNLGQYIFVAFR